MHAPAAEVGQDDSCDARVGGQVDRVQGEGLAVANGGSRGRGRDGSVLVDVDLAHDARYCVEQDAEREVADRAGKINRQVGLSASSPEKEIGVLRLPALERLQVVRGQ